MGGQHVRAGGGTDSAEERHDGDLFAASVGLLPAIALLGSRRNRSLLVVVCSSPRAHSVAAYHPSQVRDQALVTRSCGAPPPGLVTFGRSPAPLQVCAPFSVEGKSGGSQIIQAFYGTKDGGCITYISLHWGLHGGKCITILPLKCTRAYIYGYKECISRTFVVLRRNMLPRRPPWRRKCAQEDAPP